MKIGPSMRRLENICSPIIPTVSQRTDFQRILYSSGVLFTSTSSASSSSQSIYVSGTFVDSIRCKSLACQRAFLKGMLVAIFKTKVARLWRMRRPRKMKKACWSVTTV